MSDFFTRLSHRALGIGPKVTPLVRGMFEPETAQQDENRVDSFLAAAKRGKARKDKTKTEYPQTNKARGLLADQAQNQPLRAKRGNGAEGPAQQMQDGHELPDDLSEGSALANQNHRDSLQASGAVGQNPITRSPEEPDPNPASVWGEEEDQDRHIDLSSHQTVGSSRVDGAAKDSASRDDQGPSVGDGDGQALEEGPEKPTVQRTKVYSQIPPIQEYRETTTVPEGKVKEVVGPIETSEGSSETELASVTSVDVRKATSKADQESVASDRTNPLFGQVVIGDHPIDQKQVLPERETAKDPLKTPSVGIQPSDDAQAEDTVYAGASTRDVEMPDHGGQDAAPPMVGEDQGISEPKADKSRPRTEVSASSIATTKNSSGSEVQVQRGQHPGAQRFTPKTATDSKVDRQSSKESHQMGADFFKEDDPQQEMRREVEQDQTVGPQVEQDLSVATHLPEAIEPSKPNRDVEIQKHPSESGSQRNPEPSARRLQEHSVEALAQSAKQAPTPAKPAVAGDLSPVGHGDQDPAQTIAIPLTANQDGMVPSPANHSEVLQQSEHSNTRSPQSQPHRENGGSETVATAKVNAHGKWRPEDHNRGQAALETGGQINQPEVVEESMRGISSSKNVAQNLVLHELAAELERPKVDASPQTQEVTNKVFSQAGKTLEPMSPEQAPNVEQTTLQRSLDPGASAVETDHRKDEGQWSSVLSTASDQPKEQTEHQSSRVPVTLKKSIGTVEPEKTQASVVSTRQASEAAHGLISEPGLRPDVVQNTVEQSYDKADLGSSQRTTHPTPENDAMATDDPTRVLDPSKPLGVEKPSIPQSSKTFQAEPAHRIADGVLLPEDKARATKPVTAKLSEKEAAQDIALEKKAHEALPARSFLDKPELANRRPNLTNEMPEKIASNKPEQHSGPTLEEPRPLRDLPPLSAQENMVHAEVVQPKRPDNPLAHLPTSLPSDYWDAEPISPINVATPTVDVAKSHQQDDLSNKARPLDQIQEQSRPMDQPLEQAPRSALQRTRSHVRPASDQPVQHPSEPLAWTKEAVPNQIEMDAPSEVMPRTVAPVPVQSRASRKRGTIAPNIPDAIGMPNHNDAYPFPIRLEHISAPDLERDPQSVEQNPSLAIWSRETPQAAVSMDNATVGQSNVGQRSIMGPTHTHGVGSFGAGHQARMPQEPPSAPQAPSVSQATGPFPIQRHMDLPQQVMAQTSATSENPSGKPLPTGESQPDTPSSTPRTTLLDAMQAMGMSQPKEPHTLPDVIKEPRPPKPTVHPSPNPAQANAIDQSSGPNRAAPEWITTEQEEMPSSINPQTLIEKQSRQERGKEMPRRMPPTVGEGSLDISAPVPPEVTQPMLPQSIAREGSLDISQQNPSPTPQPVTTRAIDNTVPMIPQKNIPPNRGRGQKQPPVDPPLKLDISSIKISVVEPEPLGPYAPKAAPKPNLSLKEYLANT